MTKKDRLIVWAAIAPAVLAFPVSIALTHDLIVSGLVGVAASLATVAISLTPPVRAARIRLLRRKYPVDS